MVNFSFKKLLDFEIVQQFDSQNPHGEGRELSHKLVFDFYKSSVHTNIHTYTDKCKKKKKYYQGLMGLQTEKQEREPSKS